jgi:hypothetical protein
LDFPKTQIFLRPQKHLSLPNQIDIKKGMKVYHSIILAPITNTKYLGFGAMIKKTLLNAQKAMHKTHL